MRLAARFISLTVGVVLLLLCFKPAFAQTQTTTEVLQPANFAYSNTNPDVKMDMTSYTQTIMLSFMGGIGCQLAGYNPVTQDHQCLGYDKSTGKYGYVDYKGGMVGFLGNMITVLYTPPIHTSDYFRYLASNFGITKGAYAQYGKGLDSLYPISGLFVTFRNVAYYFFVIIFIFIGLGIMLRLKIDPRTVMSIQNQIPKVIVGLILITLSFAISGLVIDIMWVLIIAIINTLETAHPALAPVVNTHNVFITPFSMSDVVGGFLGISINTAGAVGNTFNAILNPNNYTSGVQIQGIIGTQGCNPIFFLDLGCYIGQAVSKLLSIIVGTIAFFVIIIAIIVSLFRLWFALLKAYILAIFDIIFAPFWIVAGLIPRSSQNLGFMAWLRDLIGNLLPFPAVIGLFMIARIIADGLTNAPNFFIPPLLGGCGDANACTSNLGAIISFGIIMWSPSIVSSIKNLFKAGGPSGSLGGVSSGLAAVTAVGGAAKRRLYFRDSSGTARGLGAEAMRAGGRRINNTMSGTGVGNVISRSPLGALKRRVDYLGSHEIQTASDDEYKKAMAARAQGKSAREAESEIERGRRASSNQDLVSAFSAQNQPAPLTPATQQQTGSATINASQVNVNGPVTGGPKTPAPSSQPVGSTGPSLPGGTASRRPININGVDYDPDHLPKQIRNADGSIKYQGGKLFKDSDQDSSDTDDNS